jgi:uncharacterized protein YjbJ (UPF0337 family)
MNWEQVRGQAKQVEGKLKQKWAKLTDDDMMLLKGKKDEFLGRLKERTGLAKEEAERQLDALIEGLSPSEKQEYKDFEKKAKS